MRAATPAIEATTVDALDWSADTSTLWAGHLARCSNVNPLGEPGWFDVLSENFRPALTLFVARDSSGGTRGILPTYTVRGLRGARHLFSLRHGLNAENPEVARSLLDAAADHCRKRDISSAIVTTGLSEVAVPCRQWARESLSLALPKDSDELWTGFRDKVRNTIRKAERGDIVVSTSMDQLDGYWRMSADAMAAQNLPVKPRRFFRAIGDSFGDRALLYTAHQGGAIIGGMLVITRAPIACYAYGAFSLEGRRLGVNSALLWRVASDMIDEGFSELDLGESTPGGGTYKFKQRLGGVAQQIHYFNPLSPTATDQGPTATAAATGGTGVINRIVGALPLAPRRAALTWLGGYGRLI